MTPFQVVEGFDDRWWHGRAGRVGEDSLEGREYIQFLADGMEVGRAEVAGWQLSDSYFGIDSEVLTKEIWSLKSAATFADSTMGLSLQGI